MKIKNIQKIEVDVDTIWINSKLSKSECKT
jgi:hypothetical protein